MLKTPIHVALAASMVLCACGGGGGSNPASSDPVDFGTVVGPQSAEGFWSGVSSDGTTLNLAVLENGESWGIYTSTQGSYISGALQGQTSTSGADISGSGSAYDFSTGSVKSGNLTGRVISKSTMLARSLVGFSVTLNYNAGYDARASLADLAGKYLIFGRSGRSIILPNHVEISPSGTFTSLEVECTRLGTFAPRASGKNMFDFSLTFSGNCPNFASGSSVHGVAFLDKSTIPYRLHSMALGSNKADAVVVIGTKQLIY